MLWVRRNVRREKCGRLKRHDASQVWRCEAVWRGCGNSTRQLVPNANFRGTASSRSRRTNDAYCGNIGQPQRGRIVNVRVGKTAAAPEFSVAARRLLENSQLRQNVHHATDIIRAKRALRVEE